MKAKTQIGNRALVNEQNYADGWLYRLLYGKQLAALEAEQEYNQNAMEQNWNLDQLEAQTTLELSEQEKEIRLAQIELYKNIGIAVVIIALVIVIIKM
ncbi:MAG: hypothetical protein RBT49_11820 [Bacteroidales bacterium]|jgi:hypothetical protein|nr:hypothetical protein [Bacteroidales bacterium]